jgi:8-oxo-dGTP pyrophosphatase MutT (NUDIX family)
MPGSRFSFNPAHLTPFRDPRLERLATAIDRHPLRRVGDTPGLTRAAVALVVRPRPRDLEILLIKRAPRAGDPWSGHMALPGGRQDREDADPLVTAARETLEEVGIDLRSIGRHLGRLDEVQPLGAGVPPIAIAPFTFAVPAGTGFVPNVEVAEAMWIPVGELAAPDARAEYIHHFVDGRSLQFPAIACRGETIWGLTYRILSQFMALATAAREIDG